jgi:hydrogenase maturation protease
VKARVERRVRSGTGVVIGVGNPFRRDDGVGHAVTNRVAARVGCRPTDPASDEDSDVPVRVVLLDGEPSRVIDAWSGASVAIVIDAVCSGAPPGSVQRIEIDFDVRAGEPLLPARRSSGSTHSAGVAEAVALGRALARVPDRLVVYAIEGADFGEGPGLSCEVDAALVEAASRVLAELAL